MPLDAIEVQKHAAKGAELVAMIKAIIDPDGPGGKKATIGEILKLAGKASTFVAALLADIAD